MRSDTHQGEFLGLINFGSGLKVSRRQPAERYALSALPHAIIHLRPSAVN